jgi:hypothetical protein
MATHLGMRDALIRELFELERDFAYRTFRRLHIENPEIVQACPKPELREEMLRGFWNQDAEKRFAEYRQAVAGKSVAELLDIRADLIEQSNARGLQEYLERRGKPAHSPDKDNEKGRDR